MSLVGRLLKHAIKEIAKPILSKTGDHIGDAIGTVLAKRIDPNHGKTPATTVEESESEDE